MIPPPHPHPIMFSLNLPLMQYIILYMGHFKTHPNNWGTSLIPEKTNLPIICMFTYVILIHQLMQTSCCYLMNVFHITFFTCGWGTLGVLMYVEHSHHITVLHCNLMYKYEALWSPQVSPQEFTLSLTTGRVCTKATTTTLFLRLATLWNVSSKNHMATSCLWSQRSTDM